MSGVPNIKIAESVEQLKSLMKQQKTPLNYAKVQALYLLKIKAAPDSKILGSNYWTFRIDNSCLVTIISGRRTWKITWNSTKKWSFKKIDVETVAEIQKELKDPEGFYSYKEIQIWLIACLDIQISYSTIHRTVRYELQGKLKTPRPVHENQKLGVIEVFKRYLPTKIKGLIEEYREKKEDKRSIAYWCQDETRLGFRTFSGKK